MTVTNPATGEVIAEVPYATAEEVDTAVRTAHEAFLKWREVPVVDRVQVLYRYKTLLDKHHEDLARILTTRERQDLSRTPRSKCAARSRWSKSRAACRA